MSRPARTLEIIRKAIEAEQFGLSAPKLEAKVDVAFEDAKLLARMAKTRCRVSYENTIRLRGHGNQQSGKWLDDVFLYALRPLDLPDLTLLAVNKQTGEPSEGAFHDGRMKLTGITKEEVPAERRRAFDYSGYEALFGPMEPVPREFHFGREATSAALERETGIRRAVRNAVQRIEAAGSEVTRLAKEYSASLSEDDLRRLSHELWDAQNGRCNLTGTPFDEASEHDRVSLDRIDNAIGYARGNVQLTTIFANRARGTMSVEEARARLVQHEEGGQ